MKCSTKESVEIELCQPLTKMEWEWPRTQTFELKLLQGQFKHVRYLVPASFPADNRVSNYTQFDSEFFLCKTKSYAGLLQLGGRDSRCHSHFPHEARLAA